MKYFNVVPKQIFINYIKSRKKIITLDGDYETFTVNTKTSNPSERKSYSFSLCLAYYDNKLKKPILSNFVNFTEFANMLSGEDIKIEINFTNGLHYDNHFVYSECVHMNIPSYNKYIMNANNEYNKHVTKKSKLKENYILTKRVKSRTNLDLEVMYNNTRYIFTDIYQKFNMSIRTLGKKMLDYGYIDETILKSTLDYNKYDIEEDMQYEDVLRYAKYINNNLDKDELHYIYNDVVIQCLARIHYNQIFPGFDYNKVTLTSNILYSFLNNDLTSFQLKLNMLDDNKDKTYKYSNYSDSEINLYERFRYFFNGGLNLYNKCGKIFEDCFSLDINSSYPFVIYNFKIPTLLVKYKTNNIEYFNFSDNYFNFYVCDMIFINKCMKYIRSNIIKKALVKYYNVKEGNNCYVNDNFFRIINMFSDKKVKRILYKHKFSFKRLWFGNKNKLACNYELKTKGKAKYHVDCSDPTNIIEDKSKENKNIASAEETYIAKVQNNGLYGSPALRLFYDLFYKNEEGVYVNIENGFQNSERNVIFSAFVTSQALYNLLKPLSYIPVEKIDHWFIYCDTDSLYLKKECYKYIDKSIYDKYNLGQWDIEHKNIDKIYVLNHKKYCFLENNKIFIHCGGVRLDSFNTKMKFEDFIRTQFSEGCEVKTLKSILNVEDTISIYESTTKLSKGKDYPIEHNESNISNINLIKKMIKEDIIFTEDDNPLLFVETEFGNFSRNDLIDMNKELNQNNNSVLFLIRKNKEISDYISNMK